MVLDGIKVIWRHFPLALRSQSPHRVRVPEINQCRRLIGPWRISPEEKIFLRVLQENVPDGIAVKVFE